jgi:phytoene synthase
MPISRVELRAAGITDPALASAYAACRAINAGHGHTYFLATRLLPAGTRPSIHALYGFARLADEIVDGQAATEDKAVALDMLQKDMHAAFAGAGGPPVLAALADTAARHRIPPDLFTDFLGSMRMDLHVTDYATFEELGEYMHGSAGVIGLQLLPVFGTVGSPEEAAGHACALGVAFQLTNFLRDVGEDLDRGRIYLPAAELAAFGVDRDRLTWARRTGRADPAIRRALAYLVGYTYAVYRRAEPGIALLRPEARPCVATAATLYRGILDRIVAAEYDVLHRRVVVPARRRLGVAIPGLVRALAARAPVARKGL